MDTGKILDCEPMNRSCKACSLKLKLKKSNSNAFKHGNHHIYVN